ncbi:hypothetical protein HORIV_54760 [Vreelandella olivaria]|uniref:DUF294 domain-containing protein n=1 Tax=Vreelandella olivaria TaxID=390919 RepID=A0ABM7GQU4_9GAMM|nr:hypothetical protein HORIV_54760 [Halomonas olivaria]
MALFSELRLKQQLAALETPGGAQEANGQNSSRANRVVVQNLSSLERDLLREAMHIVKDFKQRLSHRYHLEYS